MDAQYQLTLFTIPIATSFPEIAPDATKGQIFLSSPSQNYFRVGQKFYLSPTVTGQGQDASITRTVVSLSSSMVGGVAETTIVFTPPPLANWTCSARATLIERVVTDPFVGYIITGGAATPSASQIAQCITVCDEYDARVGL